MGGQGGKRIALGVMLVILAALLASVAAPPREPQAIPREARATSVQARAASQSAAASDVAGAQSAAASDVARASHMATTQREAQPTAEGSQTGSLETSAAGEAASPPKAGAAQEAGTSPPGVAASPPGAAAAQEAGTSAPGAAAPPGAAAAPEPAASIRSYDLIIYSTSTAGMGALRTFTLLRGTEFCPTRPTLAIISLGHILQCPMANGLLVEDMFHGHANASGPYRVFRENMMYPRPLDQRATWTPERARAELWFYINRGSGPNGPGRPGVDFFSARLDSADPFTRTIVLNLEDGDQVTLSGRLFIDASIELDLARMMGVDYRIGRDETAYNDRNGNIPPPPSAENDYRTAPQAIDALSTFGYKPGAPRVASFHYFYDPSSYDAVRMAELVDLEGWRGNWSNRWRVADGLHELNEAYSDWRDPLDAYDWVVRPWRREEIRARVHNWGANCLRYVQENGEPDLYLTHQHPWPYFRGEVMIANGERASEVGVPCAEPAAFGQYQTYDRHNHEGNVDSSDSSFAWIPWRAMFPDEYPWLMCPAGACVTEPFYNSPFRMSPLQMNYGGAAGVSAARALTHGVWPAHLSYADDIRPALDHLGYSFRGH